MSDTDQTAVAVVKPERKFISVENDQPLFDTAKLEHYQRIATGLMYSTMLPAGVQGDSNLPVEIRAKQTYSNLILLLDIADRWKSSIIAVTQTASIVHGKICFEAKMIQGVLDARLGIRLKPEYFGDEGTDGYGITMTAEDGRRVKGTVADWRTLDKNGRPLRQWTGSQIEAQLHYRATREWCRRHEPALLLGIYSDDELSDMKDERVAAAAQAPGPAINGGFTRPKGVEDAPPVAEEQTDALSEINAKLESEVAAERKAAIEQGQAVPNMTVEEARALSKARKAAQSAAGKIADDYKKEAVGKVSALEKAAAASKPARGQKAAETAQTVDSEAVQCSFCQRTFVGVQIDAVHVDDDGALACNECHRAPDSADSNEVEGDTVSDMWKIGYEDGRAGKPQSPGKKVTDQDKLDYAMGYNQGAAELLNEDPEDDGEPVEEEVLDDPPPEESIDYKILGFDDGYAGKPRNPPRGLVAVQINEYVAGHAAGLEKLKAEEEAADLADRDPFKIYEQVVAQAPSWAEVKNALVILNKTPAWAADSKVAGSPRIKEARKNAWARVDSLETAGGEFVDMTLDLTAFRCFVEFETDAEIITNYWETLVSGQLYAALPDDKKKGLEAAIRDRIRELGL